jgi:riboflavin-specific deaminase-like protein
VPAPRCGGHREENRGAVTAGRDGSSTLGYTVEFRQLFPEPGTVEVAELLGGLDLGGRAPGDRPFTMLNFVASVDGRATFQRRSGQLGDDGDRALFHALRERADAVLVGTGTLRAEHYGRLVRNADTRELRHESGRSPEPLACVATRSGNVPLDIPLFAEPEANIIVFTPRELDAGSCAAHVEIVRLDPARATFSSVVRHLHEHHGVRVLLCEGGPTVGGALLHEGLVDELFLTLAPKLTGGGSGPTITSGPELPAPAALTLDWALERAGSLYLRYVINV